MRIISKVHLIVLLALSLLVGAMALGKHEMDTPKNTTIVLGGDAYFPPFEYLDENENYKGFNVDIMRAIEIDMAIDIDIVPMMWKDAIAKLQAGEIDGVQGMKYTTARARQFDFSTPYFTSALAIFIKSDNNFIKSIDDLTNLKVAVQTDDVAYSIVTEVSGVKIVGTDSQLQALQLLATGSVDAYVGNRETGLYSIQKYGNQDCVKIIGAPINPQSYSIALQKGSDDKMALLNRGLANIKKDGTYDKIYKKWFGEQIYSTKEALKAYLYTFLVILACLALIFGLMMRWNQTLKREVKKQTRALQDDAIYKSQIINSIFSGLITFDTEGQILTVNQNIGVIFKCDSAQFVGKKLQDTPLHHVVSRDKFKEVTERGTRFINLEQPTIIDGKARDIEYNIYPLKTVQGKIVGITITLLDITEEKYNANIIRRKDKLASLGRLTANIAHEIRNPLTAIKTYIELIPQKIANPSFQQKIVEDVPADIRRVNALIAQLLDYAKPQRAAPDIVNLQEATQKVVNIYTEMMVEKLIELRISIDSQHCAVVDSNHYKQILSNLLLNAIDAVSERTNAVITIDSTRVDDQIKLAISDNGVGFEAGMCDMLFEPFYTTKSEGTGLGLAIVQQLVEENGAHIQAEHTGGLTRVELYLKAVPYKGGCDV